MDYRKEFEKETHFRISIYTAPELVEYYEQKYRIFLKKKLMHEIKRKIPLKM